MLLRRVTMFSCVGCPLSRSASGCRREANCGSAAIGSGHRAHLGGFHQRLQHAERMRTDNALARQARAVAVEHRVEQRIETFRGIAHHPILLQQLMQRGAVRQRVPRRTIYAVSYSSSGSQ